MIAAASLFALVAPLPQGQEPVFTGIDHATESGGTRTTISGDRRSFSCLETLQQQTAAMGWNVRIDGKPLQNDLQFNAGNLAFAEQDPLVMARGRYRAIPGGALVVRRLEEATDELVLRTPEHRGSNRTNPAEVLGIGGRTPFNRLREPHSPSPQETAS